MDNNQWIALIPCFHIWTCDQIFKYKIHCSQVPVASNVLPTCHAGIELTSVYSRIVILGVRTAYLQGEKFVFKICLWYVSILRGESENIGEGEISLPNSSETNSSSAIEMCEKSQCIQMICLDKWKVLTEASTNE